MEVINVTKLVRLGKKETGKTRRSRFSVGIFEHKRQILRANRKFRKNTNRVILTAIYISLQT